MLDSNTVNHLTVSKQIISLFNYVTKKTFGYRITHTHFTHRPSHFQCLQLFFIFTLIILILLAVKKNLPSRSGWHEKPRMIDAYCSEIESLKNIFPEQSGWLLFALDTLALDLIGQPAYKSEDQICSVIFGVLSRIQVLWVHALLGKSPK